ncbi:MAG: 4Fe-4S binding protein [Alloprevotella sp.]|nr:4Fe-4S binding protein [Alloprevotella sp.]
MRHLITHLEHVLSLLIVFLLLTGTVMYSGKLFGHQFGAPETDGDAPVYAAPDSRQTAELGLPANATFTPTDSAAWTVRNADGEDLGYIITTEPYGKDIRGFCGPTPVYLFFDTADTLRAISALDNAESPGWWDDAAAGVFPQFVGTPAEALATKKVDAVSGATFSSTGIISHIHTTMAARADSASADADAAQPVIGWGRTLAVLAVMALGIVGSLWGRGNKPLRLVTLALNVAVLGFWCGQYLSVSLLRGWIENGTDPLLHLPLVVMLLVAVAIPFLHRPHHYCLWTCPFGSAQELMWLIPVRKWRLTPAAYALMRVLRTLVLVVLLILLWCGTGAFLLDYEPFSFFLLDKAAPAVIILGLAFLVLSMFMPHPWCRSICPLGALLDLSEDGAKKAVKKVMPHATGAVPRGSAQAPADDKR